MDEKKHNLDAEYSDEGGNAASALRDYLEGFGEAFLLYPAETDRRHPGADYLALCRDGEKIRGDMWNAYQKLFPLHPPK